MNRRKFLKNLGVSVAARIWDPIIVGGDRVTGGRIPVK